MSCNQQCQSCNCQQAENQNDLEKFIAHGKSVIEEQQKVLQPVVAAQDYLASLDPSSYKVRHCKEGFAVTFFSNAGTASGTAQDCAANLVELVASLLPVTRPTKNGNIKVVF